MKGKRKGEGNKEEKSADLMGRQFWFYDGEKDYKEALKRGKLLEREMWGKTL